jgi:acyl-CoA thioester hydrolase
MDTCVVPYKFSEEFKVRWAETDLLAHVFFANYWIYIDEALTEYLNRLGFKWGDIQKKGYAWVYGETKMRYLASAEFEDRISVHARIGRIGNSSVTAQFQIFLQKTGALINTAEITFIVVDAKTRKPARVPHFFRRAVQQENGADSRSSVNP